MSRKSAKARSRILLLPLVMIFIGSGCGWTKPVTAVPSPGKTVEVQPTFSSSATAPDQPSAKLMETATLPPMDTPTPTPPWEPQVQALLPGEQAVIQELLPLSYYNLQVDIDFPGHAYRGRLSLEYTNAEPVPLDQLYLRLLPNGGASYGNGSLQVSNVTAGGAPAETRLSLSDTVLEIRLPGELKPGEPSVVEMDFSGDVPVDFGGEQAYGLYNYSEEVLTLSGWYPVLAVYDQDGWNLDPVSPVGDSLYSDTALYTVEVTIDKDVILASTGVNHSLSDEGEQRRWFLVSGPVRDFMIIASPNFLLESRPAGETQVNSYYLPGSEAGGAMAAQVGVDSINTFNEKFGLYPFTELDIIQSPMRNAGGVEFPGIVLIEAGRYEDPQDPLFLTTVAHEAAHQWWYNVIGNDIFEEPWLDEALTTFSSGLYFQAAFGEDGYSGVHSYWKSSYDRLVDAGRDDLVTRELAYFEKGDNARVYGAVVYIKGALFFYELRNEIGDPAYFQALQEYYDAHRFRIARGEDLLEAFEKAARRDLDAFFQEWLYNSR